MKLALYSDYAIIVYRLRRQKNQQFIGIVYFKPFIYSSIVYCHCGAFIRSFCLWVRITATLNLKEGEMIHHITSVTASAEKMRSIAHSVIAASAEKTSLSATRSGLIL
ncbi:hypothetical protein QVD17_11214 [Tagetes erecta]|uniref:Uncharacterized protein n=1 Tax=Tagetes erecta TaxID=13708 RepID=A0AAD8NUQ3_TARER|nr:hypothetical protein QVD17_11214 [Tagetes erecta]